MKNHNLKYFIPLFGILLIFFILRFQNLQSIPVFCDEAIYLRWSQVIKNVETLRFIPLTDGKQPLFMWITSALYKFISDPLLAGRFISVMSGATITIGLFIFSTIFFNRRVSIISALLYVFLPFTFFFDRLALPDTLLSLFGLTSLLFAFLLAKYPRLDLSLILGFSLGFAWLTKSPAIYFVVLSFLTFIFYNRTNYKKIYYPLISAFLGFMIYNILRLGPQFHQIALRNQDYVWSIGEIIKHPLDPLIPHLRDIISLYINYVSLPLIILVIIGFIVTKKKNILVPLNIILFLWWILPLIANAAMAKVFTARYILFTLPPLILLMSVGINNFYSYFNKTYKLNKLLPSFIIAICLIFNLVFIYQISTNPFNTKLTSTETGYLSGWTSGWGIKEASAYLIDRSNYANIIVGTEGYFGTLPDGLQIYTDSKKQLTVIGVGVNIKLIPENLLNAHTYGDEVYLLLNKTRNFLPETELKKLELIKQYPKPENDYMELYKLI